MDNCEITSDGNNMGGEKLVELCAALLDDDEFISRYVLKSEKVGRAVIDKYLRERGRSAPVMGKGSPALAPIERAKTLDEAKRLCEKFLGA